MILVGGENLIDFIQIGEKDGAPLFQAKVGGSPFSTAKALARQGMDVGYLTPVSSDSLGELLANDLKNEGVNLLAPRAVEPTSLAVVSIKSGTPSYQFYRENTAERMIHASGMRQSFGALPAGFQLGSLAITGGQDADIWTDLFVELKTEGVFTSLDPNIRAAFIHDRNSFMARLNRLLAHTDLLKLSDEDLEWIYPGTPLKDAAKMLADASAAKLAVVTLGPDGALALFGGKTVEIQAAKVDGLVDTVGAGDTFMATLVASLKHMGKLDVAALGVMTADEIKTLLTRSSAAAALNCQEQGCQPPHLARLDKLHPIAANNG